MLPEKPITRHKRRQLGSSNDLKKRLYEKGVSNSSMPSLRHPLLEDRKNLLLVNLTSAQNNSNINSPKVIRKQVSGLPQSSKLSKTSKKQFYIRGGKKRTEDKSNSRSPKLKEEDLMKALDGKAFYSSAGVGFYSPKSHSPRDMKGTNTQFYNESPRKVEQRYRTKYLVEKLSGKYKNKDNIQPSFEEIKVEERDDVIVQQPHFSKQKEESTLQEYIRLVMKNVTNIDEFLYLVRADRTEPKKKLSTTNYQTIRGEEDNPYELQIVEYQEIRQRDKQPNFDYYTISRKGFCHYFNGKPIEFVELEEWINEKEIYQKIKKLKFFNRFRRWKTIKMWKKIVVKHYIQQCSNNLEDKLFFLNPNMRECLFQIQKIGIDMGKSILLIGKNDNTYSLEGFKQVQQKNRRETSRMIQQFSIDSRQHVKKCFENNLEYLKDTLKARPTGEEKIDSGAVGHNNHKDNAFQALGFPSKMSYQHRSKLRKMTGKFVRFSYLVDILHTNSLSNIFQTQLSSFVEKLQQSQMNQVKIGTEQKNNHEDKTKEKMFNMVLNLTLKEIPDKHISERPLQSFDVSDTTERNNFANFNPIYHMVLRDSEDKKKTRKYVNKICDVWLLTRPGFDDIFEDITHLIKEGLNSLKYFERWSKHREMQKYINILEEWDDIVSDNWEIAQNDNLDPQTIIESYDLYLTKLKDIMTQSQRKLNQTLKDLFCEYLNILWENKRIDLTLLQSDDLFCPSETIQCFLGHINYQINQFSSKIPLKIRLGIFEISLNRVKDVLIQSPTEILQQLKSRLPDLAQQRTNELNSWLAEYSNKLKEEIHNIDDFVRIFKCLKEIQENFHQKKELCDDLSRMYITMQTFRIDNKKRKDFEVITLKGKDHLEQQINQIEGIIERKSEIFTKEVLRYHLPNLLRDIQKLRESVQTEKYLKDTANSEQLVKELTVLQEKYTNLEERKQKCEEYRGVLKDLCDFDVSTLNELKKQINARLLLWSSLQKWIQNSIKYSTTNVKQVKLQELRTELQQSNAIIAKLTQQLPPNEVLTKLTQIVQVFNIHAPLIEGLFNNNLAQVHWEEMYEITKQVTNLDIRRKQFNVKTFIESGIGKFGEEIKLIFHKCDVEAELQRIYSEVQLMWNTIHVKAKLEGRFPIILTPEAIFQGFGKMISTLVQILSNQFSGRIKMSSITYESLTNHMKAFQTWIDVQETLVKIERTCKLLDIKKLPDFPLLETAQKCFKVVTKPFNNRTIETGLKLSKIFTNGIEQRLQEIVQYMKKLEANFAQYLNEYRRIYPPFYLFDDEELMELISETNSPARIQKAALKIVFGLKRIQFQGERIIALITIDDERIIKTPISITLDIDQIMSQIFQTMIDGTRKMMRSCKYKALDTKLTQICYMHNLQFLLAINKVDFSHYTQISIENIPANAESLQEFLHINKKDSLQDFRERPHVTGANLLKYESILLQNFYHQQILQKLIKLNVQNVYDFEWVNQFRFTWDENTTNAEDTNITVRKIHFNIRYGNEFIGSQTRVLMNADVSFLNTLKQSEVSVYEGTENSLMRFSQGIGRRVMIFSCKQNSKLLDLKKFLMGAYFTESCCLLRAAQNLSQPIWKELSENRISEYQNQFNNKKLVSYKQKEGTALSPVFLTINDYKKVNQTFRQKFRVLQYIKPESKEIDNYLRLIEIQDHKISHLIKKVFEIAIFLDEDTLKHGLCIYQFVDSLMSRYGTYIFREGSQITLLLTHYLEKKLSKRNFELIRSHLQSVLDRINTNQNALVLKKATSKERNSKSIKPSVVQELSYTQQKAKELKDAIKQRKVVIMSGETSAKTYCLNSVFKGTHKIIPIDIKSNDYSILYGDKQNLGIIPKYLEQTETLQILHIQGVDNYLINFAEEIIQDKGEMKLTANTFICIQINSLQEIDPRTSAICGMVNFPVTDECFSERALNWARQNLNQTHRNRFVNMFNDLLIPTLNNYGPFSTTQKVNKIAAFFMVLQSLLPVQSIIEAAVYAIAWIHQDVGTQYLKLEFQVKKYLPEGFLPQGYTLFDFFYSKEPEGRQGLKLLKDYVNSFEQRINGKDNDVFLTDKLLHYRLLTKRILEKTDFGILLQGPEFSGKTTFLNLYRFQNSFSSAILYLSFTATMSQQFFKKRLQQVIQPHNRSKMGPKIGYQQSVIMIDDISLEFEQSLFNIQLVKFLIKNKVMYSLEQKKNFTVENVKYMLSSKSHQRLGSHLFCLPFTFEEQQLQNVFSKIGYTSLGYQSHTIPMEKMVHSTFQLYKKLQARSSMYIPVSYIKSIFLSFRRLKMRQQDTKEVVRYWNYLLNEKYGIFDKEFQCISMILDRNGLWDDKSPTYLYSHLQSKSVESVRRTQFVKDNRRVFNIINQKIDKYNESENKRYGNFFEFINFDQLIMKIVKMSNSLSDSDYLLQGRKGMGKYSLIKLLAYLHGFHFKGVVDNLQSTIKRLIVGITSMSSYLLCHRVDTHQQIQALSSFYQTDFETEILNSTEAMVAQLNTKNNNFKDTKNSILSNNKLNKGTNNGININIPIQSYVTPHPKLSQQQVSNIRRNLRIVVIINQQQTLSKIPDFVLENFIIDFLPQIPEQSFVEYNMKLLEVDEVICTNHAMKVLNNIYSYAKQPLKLQLKANDDCVRLFSSFISSLVDEMKAEIYKYEKILDLFQQLQRFQQEMSKTIESLYTQVRELSQKIKDKEKQIAKDQQKSQSSKQKIEDVHLIQQLREPKLTQAKLQQVVQSKSSVLSRCEKMIEVLMYVTPNLKQKFDLIHNYVSNKEFLEQSLAVTASYFTYLSSYPYAKRREVLSQWYSEIDLLKPSSRIDSFLPLFNLYKEEFNADQRDDLEDFYQNMAIIFNSIKPVIIEDVCNRGRNWLESLCSFITVSEDQKNFNELITECLGKGTNIIIRITKQETMNNLNNSFINSLLYLSDSTPTINMNGEEIAVNRQTKVYLLLAEGVLIPPQNYSEFIRVRYDQSPKMIQGLIEHEFISTLKQEVYFPKVDLIKKEKSLRLECSAIEAQISQVIGEEFYPEDQQDEDQQPKPMYPKDLKDLKTTQFTPQQIQKILADIVDKKITKIQSLFNKHTEKSKIITDLQAKAHENQNCQQELCFNFYNRCQVILQSINLIARGSPEHNQIGSIEFMKIVAESMKRGFVKCGDTLVAFFIRFWGNQLIETQYITFVFILLILLQKGTINQLKQYIRGDTNIQTESEMLKNIIKEDKNINLVRITQLVNKSLYQILCEVEYEDLCQICNCKQIPLLQIRDKDTPMVVLICVSSNINSFQAVKKKIPTQDTLFQPKLNQLENQIKKAVIQKMDIFIVQRQELLQEALEYLRKYSTTSFIEQKIFFVTTNPIAIKEKFNGPLNENHQTKVMFTSWYINNQMDFIKQIWINKAECRGIQPQADLIHTRKAIESIPSNKNLTLPEEIKKDQQQKTDETSFHERILLPTLRYLNRFIKMSLISTKEINRSSFKGLSSLAKLCQDNEEPISRVEFALWVLNCIENSSHIGNLPYYEGKIVEVFNKIKTKIQSLQLDSCSQLSQQQELIIQLITKTLQDYESQNTQSGLFDVIKMESDFLLMKLTWMESLRNILHMETFTPRQFFNDTLEISQLTDPQSKGPIKPVRKSRQMMKTINMTIYTNRKKKNKLKEFRAEGEIQNDIQGKNDKEIVEVYLQCQLDRYKRRMKKIHSDILRINQNLPYLNMMSLEEAYQIVRTIVTIQYGAVPSAWKLLLKSQEKQASLIMIIRELAADKKRLSDMLQRFKSDSSTEIEFDLLEDPLEYMKTFFSTEFFKQEGQFYFLSPSSVENQELKVLKMYTVGWKLTSQGYAQTSESKCSTITGCSFYRRPYIPQTGFNIVDVYATRASNDILFRAYVPIKKSVTTSLGKIYLK